MIQLTLPLLWLDYRQPRAMSVQHSFAHEARAMFNDYDHRQWRISRADITATWIIVAVLVVIAGVCALL